MICKIVFGALRMYSNIFAFHDLGQLSLLICPKNVDRQTDTLVIGAPSQSLKSDYDLTVMEQKK